MVSSPPKIVWIFVVAMLFIGIAQLRIVSIALGPIIQPLSFFARPLYATGSDARRIADALSEKPANPDELKKIIDQLQIENAKLRAVSAENDALKTALNFKEKQSDTTVVARTLSASADDMTRALIIDRGTNDGIRIGQPVITGDGIIIGKIAAVNVSSATVLLLFDAKSKLAVTIQTAKETLGILEGDRGLSMQITLIPQTQVLTAGTTIITSGLEPGIRRGFIVGSISALTQDAQQQFQSARVAPPRDALYPLFVQVIISS